MSCAVMMLRTLLLMLALTPVLAADVSEDGEPFDTTARRRERDPSSEALRRMFDKYGQPDGRMTFEGFEHLLESIGLGRFSDDHDHHHHHHHQHHADHPAAASLDHQQRHERSADGQQSSANGTDISQVCILRSLVIIFIHHKW